MKSYQSLSLEFQSNLGAADKESFSALQEERREQAERSVLISCPPNINQKKFLDYISKHGDIQNHFFYQSYVSVCCVLLSAIGTHALRQSYCDNLSCCFGLHNTAVKSKSPCPSHFSKISFIDYHEYSRTLKKLNANILIFVYPDQVRSH